MFAHGQLYAAFSRGKCARGIRVFSGDHKDGLTDNIVCSELHFCNTMLPLHFTVWLKTLIVIAHIMCDDNQCFLNQTPDPLEVECAQCACGNSSLNKR